MESLVESKEELVGELCNFIECAIHNILYTREVYPPNLFKKVRIYNVPVWKCRHPVLIAYIKNMVDSLRPLFAGGFVDKFCLVICEDCGGDDGEPDRHGRRTTDSRKPLEQYTFSLKILDELSQCTKASLDTFLRSFLLKINVADGSFVPLPTTKPLSFYCLVHTNQDLPKEQQRRLQATLENPWISADDEEKAVFKQADVVPFKTISTQAFILQLHVEQLMER